MSILEYISNLSQDESGIYHTSRVADISYPDDGNQSCYQLEDNSFWFKHRNNCIVKAIGNFPPSGAILDVGGGNGFVTSKLLKEGYEAALIEPGPSGAINARKIRQIPEVVCAALEDLNISPSSIAAIGCFDVIEHIKNDVGFVETIHTVLKKDGLLYFTVPAHNYLWSVSDVNAGHYRRYNRKMVKELLGDKFQLLYFSYFFSLLSLPIFLFRTLPYYLKLVKTTNILGHETEHGTKKGFISKLVERFFSLEESNIHQKRFIPFGSSCLVVAKKI